jgi:hypothetical protein
MITFERIDPSRAMTEDVDAKRSVVAVMSRVKNLMRAVVTIGIGGPPADLQMIRPMRIGIAGIGQMIEEGIEAAAVVVVEAVSVEATLIEEKRTVLELVGVAESGHTVQVTMSRTNEGSSEGINFDWGSMYGKLGEYFLFTYIKKFYPHAS